MKKAKQLILDLCLVLLGNLIYAAGVALFIIPGNLITGGTTGIALFVNRLFRISVADFALIFNIIMFILGFAVLGKKFAATTAVSTFSYPLFLKLVQHLLRDRVITTDRILCTVFGGLCIGAAIGIVIRAGSSTGGMDIPPLVLNKFFKIPVSFSLYLFDMLILLMQAVNAEGEQILYGILLVMIYTAVLNQCLLIGKNMLQLKIVSEKSDAIKELILHRIDRGVTLLSGRTGLMGKETELVLTVMSPRELARAKKEILKIDPKAFMVVSKVSEVSGRGFSLEKIYID